MPELRVYLLNEPLINPAPPPADGQRTIVPTALLALVTPKLIEGVLTGVATALKKAGSDQTVQISGETVANLYVADAQQALRPNPSLRTLLAVWFEPPAADASAGDHDATGSDRVTAALEAAKLVPRGSSVGGVFEAQLRETDDRTAFFLDARHFSIRTFLGDRHRDRRGYIVSVGLAVPAADPEGHTIALGHVDFGSLTRGASVVAQGQPIDAYPRYRSNLMPWSPISSASKAAYDRDVAAGRASGREYMPVAITVTVSETAEGHPFLLKLGEILGGAARETGAAIAKQIAAGGAEREPTAAEKAATAEELYDEELKAQVDEAKARRALSEAAAGDEMPARLAWELAARRLAWRTRLRQAAGLASRGPLEPA
jgi:hypothetical protein